VVDGVNTGAPKLYYVHTDHLGRPARMTAQNQGWVWDVIYAPFGAVSYIWTNPETMDLRFPGQWFQLETGLAYNWHRHYDPSLGRYIQPDPLGLETLLSDGPSVYGYVGGNPLAQTDPTGLSPFTGFCLVGGIANPLCDIGILQDAVFGLTVGVEIGVTVWEMAKGRGTSEDCPSAKDCSTAIRLLTEFERLSGKYEVELGAGRERKLREKRANGTITSDDLPQTIRKKFPSRLAGKTLNEIRALCGKSR
jgi:RHS repeat-associated protein